MLLAGLLVLSCCISPTYATTYEYNSSGQSFNNGWELIKSGSHWTMKYGFNKSWIDEDYTHTYSNRYNHVATVSNLKGAFSDSDSAGHWAGIEVCHKGSHIRYSITF